MLASLTLFLLASLAPPPIDEVDAALRRLDAPRAAERAAAERWLALHLDPEHLVPVAAAAAEAGPEVLRRLGAALGSDERHLELVSLLLSDSQLAARGLGEVALQRLVSDWLGDGGLEPASSLAVLQALIDGRRQEYRWLPRPGDFEELIDDLVLRTSLHRRGEPGFERIEVVLNPRLSAARFDPSSRQEAGAGPLVIEDEAVNLLFHAALVQGVGIEGFALGRSERARPWLHLVPKDQLGLRRADELIGEWLVAVLEAGDAQRARAGARALGACGWAAALEWLEGRWRERNDANAMEGVLLAAARDRVAPILLRTARVESLLGEADAALSAPDRVGRARAALIMNALAALPPRGAGGSDLVEPVARGWAELGPRRRLLRATILAGMKGAPRAWREDVRAQLAAPDTTLSLQLAWAQLRALAGAGARPPAGGSTVLESYARQLEAAGSEGVAEQFVATLRAAHLRPPDRLREPAALPPSWGAVERALTVQAWLGGGEPETAARHLRALASRAPNGEGLAAAEVLRRTAPAGWLASVLEAPPAAGAADPALRLATLLGLLPDGRHGALVEALASAGEPANGDLDLLAALAAGPAGERARELLTAAVRRDVEGVPWEGPFERAHSDLSAQGRDEEAARFLHSIRSALRRSEHPRRTDLIRRRWPRPPGAAPFPLEALGVHL